MELDARQTRSLFLAGTVAFPTPFPSSGTISFDVGRLTYSPCDRPMEKDLVISQEYQIARTNVRLMLQDDVSAIFVPGVRDERGAFQISNEPCVEDFEKGEWFLDTDVNPGTVRARLNLKDHDDISTRNSILRGIVFIPEDRATLHITELAQKAGADCDSPEWGCTPCRLPY